MLAAVAEPRGLWPVGTFLLVSFFFVVTTRTTGLYETLHRIDVRRGENNLLRESAIVANEVKFSITIFKIISPWVKPPPGAPKQPRRDLLPRGYWLNLKGMPW